MSECPLPVHAGSGWPEGNALIERTCTRRTARFLLLIAGQVLAPAALAGHVVSDNGRYRFLEDFRWKGNHAATIAAGAATTVWMDESSWDVRGDTSYIAVTPGTDDGITFTNAFHVDIHKAASTDPRSGVIDNTHYNVGGDGSAGIGIFHLDYQDILSARLRNPMLISAAQPGVVRFYAPLFNTTGHWWELAITPADQVIGGEHTTVPSVNSGLPEPGSSNAQPGPGHDAAADSLNLVAFGSADYPCLGFPGWRTRFGVSKTQNGTRSHYITQSATQGDFVQTDPSQANTLVLWEIQYFPDHVALLADFDGDGNVSSLESWPVTLPWSEVHVHLMAVGYQSTHHPASTCNLGQIREIQWRNVEVYPVKYARTDVFPKNVGTQQLPKELGFSSYDLRDIQRFGAAVNGVPQPNDAAFSANHPGKYCVDGGYPCFSSTAQSPNLALALPANVGEGLLGAKVLADLKDAAGAGVHASAAATLNGAALGRFPEHDAVLTDANDWAEWVRRALPAPAAAVHAGANTLGLALETGAYVDRVELELLYGPGPDLIFRNGFESNGSATVAATAYRAPSSGDLRIAYPLFPVGSDEHLLHQCAE